MKFLLVLASLLPGLACAQQAGAESRWLDNSRPRPETWAAIALLRDAGTEGLQAEDYAAGPLQATAERLDSGDNGVTAARLEQALSSALAAYRQDLTQGRVSPLAANARYRPQTASTVAAPSDGASPATAGSAVAPERGDQALPARPLEPPFAAELRRALAHYRQLAADPASQAAWAKTLPPPAGRKLEPGQAYAALAELARRLQILGDLHASTSLPSRYEGALVDGVKTFQSRHGLNPDGVVGQSTLAALAIAPAQRLRQIELNLERLRWTPLQGHARLLLVNIPEFRLRALVGDNGQLHEATAMRVIVGQARKTPTPLFDESMRLIEFNPYWNVPPSIARSETIPRLQRDPDYFTRQGFEFVDGSGQVSTELSDEHLANVRNGRMRLRQRPGSANALGDIKFIFPNHDNIYLHHTPTPRLFARDRRDFSHGCIRVEQPVDLARFVLAPMAEWDEARIREAMQRGKSSTLRLVEPLPVILAYFTALPGPDGRMHFFNDLYHLDAALDDALRRRIPPAQRLPELRALSQP